MGYLRSRDGVRQVWDSFTLEEHVDNREEAQRLYAEALIETDPQRRAELYAEADFLMEDEELYASEEEVTEEEITELAPDIDWNFPEDDDDIEFEPDTALLDEMNEGGSRETAN